MLKFKIPRIFFYLQDCLVVANDQVSSASIFFPNCYQRFINLTSTFGTLKLFLFYLCIQYLTIHTAPIMTRTNMNLHRPHQTVSELAFYVFFFQL